VKGLWPKRANRLLFAFHRGVPYFIRAAIRYMPPRGRGIRLARLWTRIDAPSDLVLLTPERSGMRLRCDLRDELSWLVFYRGSVDSTVEQWIRRWLRPGDTYVDVGAHIGFYVSIALEAIGPGGHVMAFEPLAENFQRLSVSLGEVRTKYPKTRVYRAAVGSRCGLATLYRPKGRWEHQFSRASLSSGRDLTPAERVSVVALDDVLAGAHSRLIKVDVEGHELAVIHGAESILSSRKADAILIELNPSALGRAGTTLDEVGQALVSHGYQPHRIGPDGELAPWNNISVEGEFTNAVYLPRNS
jgi:FkbM family methyltransferase